jgi:hypothetical protein
MPREGVFARVIVGERIVPETGFNFLETRQARIGKEDLNGYLHIFTPFP